MKIILEVGFGVGGIRYKRVEEAMISKITRS